MLFTADAQDQQKLWDDFKAKFNSVYSNSEEEQYRKSVFLENLKIVDDLQQKSTAAGGSAVFGVSKFSDMTQVNNQFSALQFVSFLSRLMILPGGVQGNVSYRQASLNTSIRC